MIRKFVKKPIEIEAYQITRELLEGILFDGKPYPAGLSLQSAVFEKETRSISAWFGQVITIHNQITTVVEGDWIITEPDGIHHYPCKPDIFNATYLPSATSAWDVIEVMKGWNNIWDIICKNYNRRFFNGVKKT